jgi:hypothetical protein
LRQDQPDAQPNKNFAIDMINVLIGIVWQTSLTASAIFLVIQEIEKFWLTAGLAVACTLVLKFSWWDRLRDAPES